MMKTRTRPQHLLRLLNKTVLNVYDVARPIHEAYNAFENTKTFLRNFTYFNTVLNHKHLSHEHLTSYILRIIHTLLVRVQLSIIDNCFRTIEPFFCPGLVAFDLLYVSQIKILVKTHHTSAVLNR